MTRTPNALIEHGRLARLCAELYKTSLELTPELTAHDHLDRVAAAVGALTLTPDPWLEGALAQAIEQLQIAGLIQRD